MRQISREIDSSLYAMHTLHSMLHDNIRTNNDNIGAQLFIRFFSEYNGINLLNVSCALFHRLSLYR